MGLSRTALVNIEKGRHRIQIDTLYAIARALGVKLGDLLPPPVLSDSPRSLPPSLAKKLKPEEKQRVRNLLTPTGGNNAGS